jgi:hypothetical protein
MTVYKTDITKLATDLGVIASKLDNLARKEANSGTDFKTHKAMNIAYKELDGIRMLLLSISGNSYFTKQDLRNMIKEQTIGTSPPQSWIIYL